MKTNRIEIDHLTTRAAVAALSDFSLESGGAKLGLGYSGAAVPYYWTMIVRLDGGVEVSVEDRLDLRATAEEVAEFAGAPVTALVAWLVELATGNDALAFLRAIGREVTR